MNYLNVNPMIQSLRTSPEDFSLKGKWLRHRASGHYFSFEEVGKVQIRAACECSCLLIKPEQQRELYDSFRAWEADYWRPLRINREFASHFRRRSWRGIVIRFARNLAAWLAEERPEAESAPLASLSNS